MIPAMKTFVPSLIAAALLGLLAFLNLPGWLLANGLALAFALGLGLWTFGQYRRVHRRVVSIGAIARPTRRARLETSRLLKPLSA
jgi:hypothetical protein